MKPLVEARGLTKRFRRRGGLLRADGAEVHAVNGVDLTVHEREALGLVGASGSGAGRWKAPWVRPVSRVDSASASASGSTSPAAPMTRFCARIRRSWWARRVSAWSDPPLSQSPSLARR